MRSYTSDGRDPPTQDLLEIVVAGTVSTVYQWRQKILTGHSFKVAGVTFGVAGVVSALIAAMRVQR